jgi:drug/metabolite transporter (DMT)-like permease
VAKILLIITLVFTQVLGDIWLSRGMKIFGEVSSFSPEKIENLFLYLLTSPWIWLGVATLVFSMLLYWMAVSRLDISYVLPMHASSYVLNALLAWAILSERVSLIRWLATIIIATGVFVVGWSEHRKDSRPIPKPSKGERKRQKQKISNFTIFLLTLGNSLPKIWLGVISLAFVDSSADILTAIGIRQVGKVPLSPSQILPWLGNIFTRPLIFVGISCNAIAFLLFITLLSWADISLVRPASAVGYIFSLLGARFILQEQIAVSRLIGIIIIGLGVATLSLA